MSGGATMGWGGIARLGLVQASIGAVVVQPYLSLWSLSVTVSGTSSTTSLYPLKSGYTLTLYWCATCKHSVRPMRVDHAPLPISKWKNDARP